MFPLPTSLLVKGLAALALAGALTGAYFGWRGAQREIGREEVRVAWEADKLARAEANRILLMANAKASSTLQAAADKERGELHAHIRSIDLERDELVRRLRNRPDRPPGGDGVPTAPGPGGSAGGCTGADLYRPDGEFLAGEAARADKLRAALRTCQAQYRRAQGAVN